MKDPEFRGRQWDQRHAEHIAPINKLVESLLSSQKDQWLPYVAPLYGGINAEILNVLQDPGPRTQTVGGSGFICLENDDPTAENMCLFLQSAGIEPARALAWNADPWYINRNPKAEELNEGARAFGQLVKLLPKLRVLMLNGKAAQNMWKRAQRQGVSLPGGIVVIETFHTSSRALLDEGRRGHVQAAFEKAGNVLRSAGEA